MGMVAILVMWSGSFEQTSIPPSQGGSTSQGNSFWGMQYLDIFPYKNIRTKFDLCVKKVKGQPGIIIWINLVVLDCLYMYTKFQ